MREGGRTKVYAVEGFCQPAVVLVQGDIGALFEPLQHFHHLPFLLPIRFRVLGYCVVNCRFVEGFGALSVRLVVS